jgi:hypothetical protein
MHPWKLTWNLKTAISKEGNHLSSGTLFFVAPCYSSRKAISQSCHYLGWSSNSGHHPVHYRKHEESTSYRPVSACFFRYIPIIRC